MIHETFSPPATRKGCRRAIEPPLVLKDESSPTIYRTRGRRIALFYHFISWGLSPFRRLKVVAR
jgi:hypothetical protein